MKIYHAVRIIDKDKVSLGYFKTAESALLALIDDCKGSLSKDGYLADVARMKKPDGLKKLGNRKTAVSVNLRPCVENSTIEFSDCHIRSHWKIETHEVK